MFLIFFPQIQNKARGFFDIIENNSVLVGVIISMVVGSLWFRKFIMHKRAEAFFSFYSRLSIRIQALSEMLNENDRLNIDDPEAGNIYTLIYIEDIYKEICPKYKRINDQEMACIKKAAEGLKKTLLETDNNVYPPNSDRKKWYESQYILFSFCEFIEGFGQHSTNEYMINGKNETKHIAKCKALKRAMEYIQSSMEKARY